MDDSTPAKSASERRDSVRFPVDQLARTLPWFRVVFGIVGILSPHLLGRWYGIFSTDGDSNEVAIRYACIRALGLGTGQLTAAPEHREEWNRVALLVDTLDTLMVFHAGLRGKISVRSAVVMLSGTVFGMVLGALSELADGRRG